MTKRILKESSVYGQGPSDARTGLGYGLATPTGRNAGTLASSAYPYGDESDHDFENEDLDIDAVDSDVMQKVIIRTLSRAVEDDPGKDKSVYPFNFTSGAGVHELRIPRDKSSGQSQGKVRFGRDLKTGSKRGFFSSPPIYAGHPDEEELAGATLHDIFLDDENISTDDIVRAAVREYVRNS